MTADGSIHMLQQDYTLWTREESLSNIAFVEAIDLPERGHFSHDQDILGKYLFYHNSIVLTLSQ
jgi:hypothetical protein